MAFSQGVLNKRLNRVWNSKLPLKLRIFLWQITHNKLPTGGELKKRKWKGNPCCNICNALETTDHIFFSCIVAKFLWSCFKEALGWDRIPVGWQDFLDNWIPLGCKDYNAKLFLLTMVTWALWTSRNKRANEGRFHETQLTFYTKQICSCRNGGCFSARLINQRSKIGLDK